MRHSKVLSALLAGALVAATAVAQEHEEHHKTPATPNPTSPESHSSMPGMSSMGMESCPHMQAGALADRLLTSLAALEKEQDLAALKVKLAAHGELLKQLKQIASQKCPMMEHMGAMSEGAGGGMMMGRDGMMGGMHQPAPAK